MPGCFETLNCCCCAWCSPHKQTVGMISNWVGLTNTRPQVIIALVIIFELKSSCWSLGNQPQLIISEAWILV